MLSLSPSHACRIRTSGGNFEVTGCMYFGSLESNHYFSPVYCTFIVTHAYTSFFFFFGSRVKCAESSLTHTIDEADGQRSGNSDLATKDVKVKEFRIELRAQRPK